MGSNLQPWAGKRVIKLTEQILYIFVEKV